MFPCHSEYFPHAENLPLPFGLMIRGKIIDISLWLIYGNNKERSAKKTRA